MQTEAEDGLSLWVRLGMAPRWVLGGLGGKEGLEVSYFLSTVGEGFWKSM